jgi:hypothetical protein
VGHGSLGANPAWTGSWSVVLPIARKQSHCLGHTVNGCPKICALSNVTSYLENEFSGQYFLPHIMALVTMKQIHQHKMLLKTPTALWHMSGCYCHHNFMPVRSKRHSRETGEMQVQRVGSAGPDKCCPCHLLSAKSLPLPTVSTGFLFLFFFARGGVEVLRGDSNRGREGKWRVGKVVGCHRE